MQNTIGDVHRAHRARASFPSTAIRNVATRFSNNITIYEHELPGVLERPRPYMISGLTHDADMGLGLKNGTKVRSKA